MHVVWNDCVSLGDTLVSFPGTLGLAKKRQAEGKDVAIAWTNADVAELFPHRKYGFHRLTGKRPACVEKISIHDMVHRRNGVPFGAKRGHPTSQFLAWVGFPELSGEIHRPEIDDELPAHVDVPYADLLIAPYVLAEIPRFWALSNWQTVVDAVDAKVSIACVGSARMPDLEGLKKINPHTQAHFAQNHAKMQPSLAHPNLKHYLDLPLRVVANMMRRAKLVVTVDSGPARLAHAVGCHHLLLCNNDVARDWGAYPEAHTIFTNLATLSPHLVIAKVAELYPKG